MLKKIDTFIGVMSISMILVGGAIIVGDKAVRVIAGHIDKAISLIRK